METLRLLLITQPHLLFSLALVPGLIAFLWLRRSGRGTRLAVIVAMVLNLIAIVALIVLAAFAQTRSVSLGDASLLSRSAQTPDRYQEGVFDRISS